MNKRPKKDGYTTPTKENIRANQKENENTTCIEDHHYENTPLIRDHNSAYIQPSSDHHYENTPPIRDHNYENTPPNMDQQYENLPIVQMDDAQNPEQGHYPDGVFVEGHYKNNFIDEQYKGENGYYYGDGYYDDDMVEEDMVVSQNIN